MDTPSTPQEAMHAMQKQTLEAIKNGQTATLEAVRAWNENTAKFTPAMPTPELPDEVKASMSSPEEIIDSVYDFAGQLLELNKSFVHQMLDVTAPKK